MTPAQVDFHNQDYREQLAAALDKLTTATAQDGALLRLAARALRVPVRSDVQPQSIPDGMALVSLEAVALAWSIIKERRDKAACVVMDYEQADKDLEILSRGGFDKHLPTLDDLRGILKDHSFEVSRSGND